jgi:hypothetical protein
MKVSFLRGSALITELERGMPESDCSEMRPQDYRKACAWDFLNRIGRISRSFVNAAAYLSLALIFTLCVVKTGWSEFRGTGNEFSVKYVYDGSVYIDAGSRSGLKVGQRLSIGRMPSAGDPDRSEVIGEIELESVTPTSAAGKILFEKSEIRPGDIALVDPAVPTPQQDSRDGRDAPKTARVERSNRERQYQKAGIEESSDPAPRNVNRIRGRIGIDYSTLQIPGSDASFSQFGFILRLDASRIAGTHWNIHGYHRGRLQSRTSSTGQQTLNDLINRTYHLNVTYENPDSNWAFGAGRLYIPWAASLNTLDGFYLGRKFGRQTAGFFMGTAPDPTSWNYSPDRRMGGVFYNIELGNFESLRFDSTSGVALSWIHWKPDRQFGFFENNIFYKNYLSVYSNIEADLLSGEENNGKDEVTLSRSYFTARFQPNKTVSFHVNHNYFRNIPTYDTRLIGTGLLDKFLFQGVSGGFRLSLPYRLGFHANAGRSSRTGDQKTSWNYLAGASVADILNSGIRLGFRFSRFDSSFGRGTYQTLSLSRELGENVQFELQAGQQDFKSLYTSQDRARFVNGNIDWFIGNKYFIGGGLTVYRGQVQDYNQVFFRLGYRFDNRRRR